MKRDTHFLLFSETSMSWRCSTQWETTKQVASWQNTTLPYLFLNTHTAKWNLLTTRQIIISNFSLRFFFLHTPTRLSLCALVIREGVVNSCSERPFCYTTPLTFMRSCADLSSNPSIHLPSFPLIWPLVILEGVADRCPGAMWTPHSWQTDFFHCKIYVYIYIKYCTIVAFAVGVRVWFKYLFASKPPTHLDLIWNEPVFQGTAHFIEKGPCLKRARLTCRRNADVSIA